MAHPTVAIIGSGFSGITTAIQLRKKLNILADVFESTEDVGGVWHYNTYPNCGCDLPSHLYSLSFELNPNWSKNFSDRGEIYQYIRNVAEKYKVYDQVQFHTKVARATWLDDKKKWELELKSVGTEETRIAYYDVVVSGVGPIRVPNIPEQFQSFEGKIIHSAEWDNDYDFNNKRVAVIGSGASSIQIIPGLQPKAAHIYSYQRTPAWLITKNGYYYPEFIKFLFRWVPFLMYFYRCFLFLMYEASYLGSRHETYASKLFGNFVMNNMKNILLSKGRPDLIEKLIPDYTVGCKRITQSDEYLQSLCEENASVIRSPITKVEGRTITTADGNEVEVDVLCLATGFNAHGFLGDMQVYGRQGLHLNKLWDENPASTYKTVNVHGFPNFCFVLGPNSGSGHNSILTLMEVQVSYIVKFVKTLIKNEVVAMDPKLESQTKYFNELQESFKGSVWASGCSSWYQGKNGGIQFLWPSTVIRFNLSLRKIDMEDYNVETE